MSISSSMNAGVMGLSANASKLSVISDNIANSSTFGYKRSVADFSSMVIGQSDTSYTAGGVRASNQRLIDERGAIVGTSNATDLAVKGRGFIPVTSEAAVNAGADLPMLLQTTGSFRTDDEGYLKSETGQVLMGVKADANGTIPNFARDSADGLEAIQINTQFNGEPTQNMTLGVNLPATATEAGAAGNSEYLSVEYFDNLGKSQNLDIEFAPTVPAAPGPASNEWTLTINDAGTTIGEYTLQFDDTPANGGTLDTVTTVSGGAYNAADGTVTVTTASGPLTVTLGEQYSPDGLTQLADSFAPTRVTKDGAPAGSLVQVEVDQNGMVNGIYDSGVTRTLYQVPLADMPNPNGLTALDDQTYRVSDESGAFFLWDAGDGPTGELQGYAREEFTADVATSLTELIQTQRAYSSNAKVIQTVDEMLQETTNIKR